MAKHRKTVEKRKIVPLPLPPRKHAMTKTTGRIKQTPSKTTGRKRK